MRRLITVTSGLLFLMFGAPGVTAEPFLIEVTKEETAGMPVVITGHLPDEATRTSLLNLLGRLLPRAKVLDHSSLDGDPLSGWSRTTRWGLSSLNKLDAGKLSVTLNRVKLNGDTSDSRVEQSILSATIGLKPEIVHQVAIQVATTVDAEPEPGQ